MLVSTTNSIEQRKIVLNIGPVFGEIIEGISFGKDIAASITNIFGGRSSSYEDIVIKTREAALEEMKQRAYAMGANAIIGVKVDYETIAQTMLMIVASGTAVVVE